jgi:hypothetical protein
VVISRATELEALVARHGTRAQARFFLASRGQDLAELEERQSRQDAAIQVVSQAIPAAWRRIQVARADLAGFVFEPEDLVVAVGQDGLVANTAKYLSGQLLLGVNPDPARYDGVLVAHPPSLSGALLVAMAARRVEVEARTLAEVRLDDGQRLRALNEVFLGHRTHQSARYRLRLGTQEERQSSSGVIVATGTGATGWARSINGERLRKLQLPAPTDAALAVFVREPFPSVSSGTSLDGAVVGADASVSLTSEMNDGGVVFADGIEEDRLELGFGVRATIGVAEERLRLVRGG